MLVLVFVRSLVLAFAFAIVPVCVLVVPVVPVVLVIIVVVFSRSSHPSKKKRAKTPPARLPYPVHPSPPFPAKKSKGMRDNLRRSRFPRLLSGYCQEFF